MLVLPNFFQSVSRLRFRRKKTSRGTGKKAPIFSSSKVYVVKTEQGARVMSLLPQPLFITFPVLKLPLLQAEQEKIDFEIQYEMVQSPLDTARKINRFYSFRRQQNNLDL